MFAVDAELKLGAGSFSRRAVVVVSSRLFARLATDDARVRVRRSLADHSRHAANATPPRRARLNLVAHRSRARARRRLPRDVVPTRARRGGGTCVGSPRASRLRVFVTWRGETPPPRATRETPSRDATPRDARASPPRASAARPPRPRPSRRRRVLVHSRHARRRSKSRLRVIFAVARRARRDARASSIHRRNARDVAARHHLAVARRANRERTTTPRHRRIATSNRRRRRARPNAAWTASTEETRS